MFPNLQNCVKVDDLWRNFFNIYVSVKNNAYPIETRVEVIKENAKSWVKDFISIYQSVNVTPYIHAFGQHLREMINLHGDVSLYTMQGLEKLNDMTTCHYFSSTNRSETYLHQLLNKRNRMESMYISNNEFDIFDLI